MDEPLIESEAVPDAPARRLPVWATATLWMCALLCEAIAVLWFIDCLATGDLARAGWLGQFLLAIGLAGLGLWLAERRRRLFYQPLHNLEALLPQIRANEAPIDDLSQISGKLQPLALAVQEILRDLRQQQSELNHELRQRVANRTSALERKIGTLSHQASRDSLTGLYNRRSFDELLDQMISRWQTSGQALSLLMMDVDHFKILNDTLGHAAGDELLRSIAQIIRSTIRATDHAFRWGGDEFAILCEGTDGPAAQVLANRLTSLVDALAKTCRGLAIPPGLSIGITTLEKGADPTPRSIIEAADRVLYEVKAARKSRRSRIAS